MGGREMPFLPAVGLLAQPAVSVIDVDRHFSLLHFRSHPEPIIVSFEKLLPDGLLLPCSKVAAPVLFPHLVAFLDVGLGRLESKRMRVINRGARGRNWQGEQRQRE